ncbi:unnamed protein product [Cylindrotheca closterium]|uniref:Leucine-rich repeat-containing N-terminal plant-type domain-containing protein n=1 Tax=Cylindrotheca closterium TaxID=2856 RepID=A0AAD2G6E8_9STRA|nr:unnamed protein product [Cylindrotheca closterium]
MDQKEPAEQSLTENKDATTLDESAGDEPPVELPVPQVDQLNKEAVNMVVDVESPAEQVPTNNDKDSTKGNATDEHEMESNESTSKEQSEGRAPVFEKKSASCGTPIKLVFGMVLLALCAGAVLNFFFFDTTDTVLKTSRFNATDPANSSGPNPTIITSSPTTTSPPTRTPSKSPTMIPTISGVPTVSISPTMRPSSQPSNRPTLSASPSSKPSSGPSSRPTMSESPTKGPTSQPSARPTIRPSEVPSKSPTERPSKRPTVSNAPSNVPSNRPSTRPTVSDAPSEMPTTQPSNRPTMTPSDRPTVSQSPTKSPTESPTRIPTVSPTNPPTRRPTETFKMKLQSYLEDDIGILVESNKANQAITQIAEEADENESLTPKLVQRYAMINMELALFDSSAGGNLGRFKQDECSWTGVKCNGNREVVDIRLLGKGMQGSIPSEIGLLQALTQLNLASNNLQGKLPEELYNCLSLEKLFLYQNRLTGTISDKIIKLWSLTDFNLSSNRISGRIPSTMRSGGRGIYKIRTFNVYDNQMTGSFPAEGSRLRQMFYLDLGRNKFSGTIPRSVFATEFVRLRYLYIDHNQFTGTLPSDLMSAGDNRLKALAVNDNRFRGALPGNHMFINELMQITAQNNQFTSMDDQTSTMDPELAAAFKRRREQVQVHQVHNERKTILPVKKTSPTSTAVKEGKNPTFNDGKETERSAKKAEKQEKRRSSRSQNRQSEEKSDAGRKASTNKVQPKSEATVTKDKQQAEEHAPISQKRKSESSNVKEQSRRKSKREQPKKSDGEKATTSLLQPKSEATLLKDTQVDEQGPNIQNRKSKSADDRKKAKRTSKTELPKKSEAAEETNKQSQPILSPQVKSTDVDEKVKQPKKEHCSTPEQTKVKAQTNERKPNSPQLVQSKTVERKVAASSPAKTSVVKAQAQMNERKSNSSQQLQSKTFGEMGAASTLAKTAVTKAKAETNEGKPNSPQHVQSKTVEQKGNRSTPRGQATVMNKNEQTNEQTQRSHSPHLSKKSTTGQEKHIKKTAVKKESPRCQDNRDKKIDHVDIDEEAPRSKSLETDPVDKYYGCEGGNHTKWKRHKKKFCGAVLLVLLVTLVFLIWSLVQFREKYANPERGTNSGGFAPFDPFLDDPIAPSPTSPSTPQPTVVPPIKIYLEDEFGITIESDEAKLAVAQLMEEATANGGNGEILLTPKTVQRFALMNMNLAFANRVSGTSRQSEIEWGQFGQDECEWKGVACNDNQEVTDILLGRQGLAGTIPSEVGLLQALTQMDLSKNNIYGTLPEELYDAVSLEKLFLYKNRLDGTISDKIINLWNLTDFVLHSNRLTGSIPSTMKSNSRGIFGIRYFNVYNNQMTGTIPANLKLRHLYYMDLGRNEFTGTVPSDLETEYVRLRHLNLDHNNFSGNSVPINAGDGRLHSLLLNDNRFTGALPGNHKFNTELNLFEVQNNGFTSMNANTCKLWVFDGGELVNFKSDCTICDCGNKSTMCDQCSV